MEAITWNADECLHGEHGCTALAEEVPIHCISLKKSKASCKLKSTTVPAPFAPSPAANALASARKLSKSYPYSPRISSLKSIGYTYGCMHVCARTLACVRACARARVRVLENSFRTSGAGQTSSSGKRSHCPCLPAWSAA